MNRGQPFIATIMVAMVILIAAFGPYKDPQPMLTIYPAPDGASPAPEFRVTADTQDVFVYDSGAGGFATFSSDAPVTVAVTRDTPFRRVDIRPLSRGIIPHINGQTVTFTLDKPGNFSIEFDGDIERPLFLFANPMEIDAPSPDAPGVHYFPSGQIHDAGVIELGSDETLYIEGGAIVHGTIRSTDATNIRVAGRGILDVRGVDNPGHLADFVRCAGVSIEGIIAAGSALWNFVPSHCTDVHIDNLKIVAWTGASDGIDVVSSENVLIENCFVRNNDDCIAVKAHEGDVRNVTVRDCVFWNGMPGNAMEIGFDLRTESVSNVTFIDCDVIRVEAGGVLTIHNGDAATVEDILFENIRVEDARETLIDLTVGFSVWSADCPDEKRPRFDDPDYVWQGSWLLPDEENIPNHSAGRGHVRNVTFRDIHVHADQLPLSLLLSYDADHGVSNVTIEGLYLSGTHVTSIDDANMMLRDPNGYPTATDSAEVRFIP